MARLYPKLGIGILLALVACAGALIAPAWAQDLEEEPLEEQTHEHHAITKSGGWMINFIGNYFGIHTVSYIDNEFHHGYGYYYNTGINLGVYYMDYVYRAHFDGNHVYACDTNDGLVILDFEQPANFSVYDPQEIITRLGNYPLSNITGMWKSGEMVYLASHSGFHVVDVSVKSTPVQSGFHAGNYTAGVGTGTVAYLLTSAGQLVALNCSTGTISETDSYAPAFAGEGLYMGTGYVIVGSGAASRLEFVDVSTPGNLQPLSLFTSGGAATMHLYQDYLYMPSGRSIMLVNVQNPSAPRVAARYNETEDGYTYNLWDDVTEVSGFADMIIAEKGDGILIRKNTDMLALVQEALDVDAFHTTWSSISLGFVAVAALFVVAEVLLMNKSKRGAP